MFTVFRVLKVSSKRTIKRMYLFIFCPEKMCFRGRKWRSKSKKQHDWHCKQIILTPTNIYFFLLSTSLCPKTRLWWSRAWCQFIIGASSVVALRGTRHLRSAAATAAGGIQLNRWIEERSLNSRGWRPLARLPWRWLLGNKKVCSLSYFYPVVAYFTFINRGPRALELLTIRKKECWTNGKI